MNVNYQFDGVTALSGYTPLTLTIQPRFIPLTGAEFLSKIVYQFPDQTVVKTNTFAVNYGPEDCRSDFVYTVPNSNSVLTINISAFVGPDNFSAEVYTLAVTNVLPKFTKNPIAHAEPYAFEEVHLVKMKAWGPDNSQVIVLETKNPDYLLVNYNG